MPTGILTIHGTLLLAMLLGICTADPLFTFPAVITPDPVVIQVGRTLVMDCTFTEYYNSNVTSNDLIIVPCNQTTRVGYEGKMNVLNSTTVQMVKHNATLEDSTLFCCCTKPCGLDDLLTFTRVRVGYPPPRPVNFTCIAINLRSMTCSWQPERKSFLPIKWQLTYKTYNDTSSKLSNCPHPSRDMLRCDWWSAADESNDNIEQSFSKYETYYISVVSINNLGKTKSDEFVVHPQQIVKPVNSTCNPYNQHTNLFVCTFHDFHEGVLDFTLFQQNNYNDNEYYNQWNTSISMSAQNVQHLSDENSTSMLSPVLNVLCSNQTSRTVILKWMQPCCNVLELEYVVNVHSIYGTHQVLFQKGFDNVTKCYRNCIRSHRLQNLIPYTKYSVYVKVRLKGSLYWSNSSNTAKVQTDEDVPEASPEVTSGSFSLYNDQNGGHRIAIYWKNLLKRQQNGRIHYEVLLYGQQAAAIAFYSQENVGTRTSESRFTYSGTSSHGIWTFLDGSNVTEESVDLPLNPKTDRAYKVIVRAATMHGASNDTTILISPNVSAMIIPNAVVTEIINTSSYWVYWEFDEELIERVTVIQVYHCIGRLSHDKDQVFLCQNDFGWVTLPPDKRMNTFENLNSPPAGLSQYFAVSATQSNNMSGGMIWNTCRYSYNKKPFVPSLDIQRGTKNPELTVTWAPDCPLKPEYGRPSYFVIILAKLTGETGTENDTVQCLEGRRINITDMGAGSYTIGNLSKNTKYAICLKVVSYQNEFAIGRQYVEETMKDSENISIPLVVSLSVIIVVLFFVLAVFLRCRRWYKKLTQTIVIQHPNVDTNGDVSTYNYVDPYTYIDIPNAEIFTTISRQQSTVGTESTDSGRGSSGSDTVGEESADLDIRLSDSTRKIEETKSDKYTFSSPTATRIGEYVRYGEISEGIEDDPNMSNVHGSVLGSDIFDPESNCLGFELSVTEPDKEIDAVDSKAWNTISTNLCFLKTDECGRGYADFRQATENNPSLLLNNTSGNKNEGTPESLKRNLENRENEFTQSKCNNNTDTFDYTSLDDLPGVLKLSELPLTSNDESRSNSCEVKFIDHETELLNALQQNKADISRDGASSLDDNAHTPDVVSEDKSNLKLPCDPGTKISRGHIREREADLSSGQTPCDGVVTFQPERVFDNNFNTNAGSQSNSHLHKIKPRLSSSDEPYVDNSINLETFEDPSLISGGGSSCDGYLSQTDFQTEHLRRKSVGDYLYCDFVNSKSNNEATRDQHSNTNLLTGIDDYVKWANITETE